MDVGLLLTAGMTYFNNVVLPESNFRASGLWKDIRRKQPGFELKAGVFYDGQMFNPPRLVWAFVRSALKAGAAAANYCEVTGFLRRDRRVTGVVVEDRLGGLLLPDLLAEERHDGARGCQHVTEAHRHVGGLRHLGLHPDELFDHRRDARGRPRQEMLFV